MKHTFANTNYILFLVVLGANIGGSVSISVLAFLGAVLQIWVDVPESTLAWGYLVGVIGVVVGAGVPIWCAVRGRWLLSTSVLESKATMAGLLFSFLGHAFMAIAIWLLVAMLRAGTGSGLILMFPLLGASPCYMLAGVLFLIGWTRSREQSK